MANNDDFIQDDGLELRDDDPRGEDCLSCLMRRARARKAAEARGEALPFPDDDDDGFDDWEGCGDDLPDPFDDDWEDLLPEEPDTATASLRRVTELVDEARYHSAAGLCRMALENHPGSADLLAEMIRCSLLAGEREEANRYLERQLTQTDRAHWTWRSYTYAIEALADENPWPHEDELRQLAADFQAHMPYDERAYAAEYRVEKALGQPTRAVEALEKALRIHPSPERCLRLLADELLAKGDFRRSRELAVRAIAASAPGRSGDNSAHCAYLICLCDDAMIWRNLADGTPPDPGAVRQLQRQYRALWRLRRHLSPCLGRIHDRIDLLNLLAGGEK